MSELKAFLVKIRTKDMPVNSWLVDWRPALTSGEALRDAYLCKGTIEVKVEATGRLWVDTLAEKAGD